MTPVHLAPCTLLCSPHCLWAWPKAKLWSILMSRIIQQECMCIFDIASSLEGWPSGYNPRVREKSREEAFVPGCQFFHSLYGPRDLPCSAWARRSPAISTWAGDFRTMDKAVRPAYRGERKGKTNFILSAFCPREEGWVRSSGHAWNIEVYSEHLATLGVEEIQMAWGSWEMDPIHGNNIHSWEIRVNRNKVSLGF